MTIFLISEITFWLCFLLLFYTHLGYPLFLWLALKLKKNVDHQSTPPHNPDQWPAVTVVIPAYNEQEIIRQKIENTLALEYPADKLHLFVIADGSQDRTVEIVREFKEVKLLYQPKREGKAAALSRAMSYVHTPLVVFCDANSLLNAKALKYLMPHFEQNHIGIVSGEKRLLRDHREAATQAGEGLYWHYESGIKRMESQFNLLLGAAGELYAMRSSLFKPIPPNIINEDFYLSMQVARGGYKIFYEPRAKSYEQASETLSDEIKRKVRISAGGLQALQYFSFMLNPFRYGWLSFQFISHKFLRWTLAPLALPVMLIAHSWLAWQSSAFYEALYYGHLLFYSLGLMGLIFSRYSLKFKYFFVPFYFLMMHFCVFAGGWELFRKRHLVLWSKAQRAEQDKQFVEKP
jgi:poly-beta-1,6-N-acetyl-D-glucosamine synthase